jgi:hypothetical protein
MGDLWLVYFASSTIPRLSLDSALRGVVIGAEESLRLPLGTRHRGRSFVLLPIESAKLAGVEPDAYLMARLARRSAAR